MEINDVLDANSIDTMEEFNQFDDYGELTAPPPDEPEAKEADDSEEKEIPVETPETSESNELPVSQPGNDSDLTKEILRLKGISDPSKIKFEDESGAIIERNWDDLSRAEQLHILSNNEDPERDLDDDEINFINLLRENNLTPQQYIETIQQEAAQKALQQYEENQQPTYEIDSLDDDQLFVLDLLEKVGDENITDEELQEALQSAKSNEALFKKQMEGMRAAYKKLEDQQKYDAEQQQIEQAEQQYQEFSNKVLDQIDSFTTFANQEVELSTNDKNDIANYLLTRSDTGISEFYSDMQDPGTATLAAFWLLKGPEVLSEMENQIKAAYQRGFAMGKKQAPVKEAPAPKAPQVVVQPKSETRASNTVDVLSAFGLEDDSYLNY